MDCDDFSLFVITLLNTALVVVKRAMTSSSGLHFTMTSEKKKVGRIEERPWKTY